ncbi:MAG: ABC transporter ATP-binding protein [Lachnospiraceae bacterium]|nr:ABC transporter ATP-binding protein [Lachnospiraceae bacterium]
MVGFEKVNKFVLRDFSLYIPKGERVGLMGEPGSGKTTLLKLACGLLVPENGSVRVLGEAPFYWRRNFPPVISAYFVGVPLLDRNDTVRQGFELVRSIYRIPESVFWEDYQELSRRMDFFAFEHKSVKELSLGQRVRAELSAALIVKPKLLLLDEPNAGLDENGKMALCEILTERGQQGLTVVTATSDMVGLAKLCTRFVLLKNGKAAFYGSGERLRSQYVPADRMTVLLDGKLPDFEDLPVMQYRIDGKWLTLFYNSNHVTAAEIIKCILTQSNVLEVKIQKPTLESMEFMKKMEPS